VNGTMRAAVLTAPGEVVVQDVAIPELDDDADVLVRTHVSSICGSDLHQIFHEWDPSEIRPPGFPCHETVGVVVESGSPAFRPGDRVLGTPDLLHASGFAEYQALPSRFLLRLDHDDIPSATLVLAQQIGTTIYAFKRFWPAEKGSGTAVVIGAGSAGLGFTTVCRLAGFEQVVVSDKYPHRTEAARRLGATTVVTGADGVVDAVLEATGGQGADLVVEAAGTNHTRLQAFECVREEGLIGWFGMNEGEDFVIPFKEVFRRKPTITMRWNAQAEEGQASFRRAVELIAAGEVDTEAYRMRTFSIDEVPEALRVAAEPADGFIKGGVVFP
jgi:L-iditol 2-dehydrogenase